MSPYLSTVRLDDIVDEAGLGRDHIRLDLRVQGVKGRIGHLTKVGELRRLSTVVLAHEGYI